MARAPQFYVRVDRDDTSREAPGTRTYKGPMPMARAERERDAWLEAFPTYDVQIIPVVEAREDMAAWSRAVRHGGRYHPTPAAA